MSRPPPPPHPSPESFMFTWGSPRGLEEIMGALRLESPPWWGLLDLGLWGLLHLYPHAPHLAHRQNP